MAIFSMSLAAEDVTWEGAATVFVDKKLSDNTTTVTVTKDASTASKKFSCIDNTKNLSYLSINGAGKYLKFAAPDGYIITNIKIVWMSGTNNQVLPILFGESISAVGSVEGVSNSVTVTNGGFKKTDAIATSGNTNCDSEDDISIPGAKQLLIGRSGAYKAADYPSIGAVVSTLKFRLNTYSGYYDTNVGEAQTPVIGRITLTVVPDCTPVDAPANLSCSAHAKASLTFGWTAASNATGYVAKLWDNSACTGDPIASDNNVATTSKTFTGLNPSTTYYCKVQSKGDGSTYCEEGGVTSAVSGTTDAKDYTVTAESNNNNYGTASAAVSSLDEGETTTITATPEEGYHFVSWSVSGTGATLSSTTTNPTTLTMGTADATVTATFEVAPQYDITHSNVSNGSYTIKVGDEAAVSTDAAAFEGQTVTLAATPASGYKFSSWKVYKTGDESTEVSVTNNSFTMPAYAVTVSATFVEATILYDCSVMTAENKWLSFTGEEVTATATGKSKTFGSSGNPQLVVTNGGWDKKDNIINSFIKFINGATSMSIVIPTNRYATVTIKYGSYNANNRYLTVGGVGQTKPAKNMVDGMTAEDYESYLGVVELTDQSGTLSLGSADGNLYIAYVDIALTGYIVPTALDNTDASVKAVKFFKDGQLFIEKNGVRYNAMGQIIR